MSELRVSASGEALPTEKHHFEVPPKQGRRGGFRSRLTIPTTAVYVKGRHPASPEKHCIHWPFFVLVMLLPACPSAPVSSTFWQDSPQRQGALPE